MYLRVLVKSFLDCACKWNVGGIVFFLIKKMVLPCLYDLGMDILRYHCLKKR